MLENALNTSAQDQLQRVNASWAKIIACLEDRRLRIHAEIRDYPMPIPACDAHFNHLLEERARVSEELGRAHAAATAAAAHSDPRAQLKILLKSISYIDDTVKQEIALHL